MKKILSKVLIAISIFNGVNASTGAMEEQTVNPSTGVSNSWKNWAENERKRINNVVDWVITNEWKICRHFILDLRESDSINKQVADNCNDNNTQKQVIIPTFPKEWLPINDYDKKFERLSWPYMFYGLGTCRNRAAWLLRYFFRNSIFARIVYIKSPSEDNSTKDVLNHAVVLYAMPDENCENRWNYYIADMQGLAYDFTGALNMLENPVFPFFSFSESDRKTLRDKYMQIPLKTYLNSKKYWCGVGFIVESVYYEPSLGFMKSVYKQIQKIVDSNAAKEKNEGKQDWEDEYHKQYVSLRQEIDKYWDDMIKSDPIYLAVFLGNGSISKEEAYKRGVTDLTMWCQKNCPEVLK